MEFGLHAVHVEDMLALLHGEAIGGNVINSFLRIVCSPDYRGRLGLSHVTGGLSSDCVVSSLYIYYLCSWLRRTNVW